MITDDDGESAINSPASTPTEPYITVSTSATASVHMIINVGDWYVVDYDGVNYPGEVTAIGEEDDFQVSVMQPAGKQYWKWPDVEDNIYYPRNSMIRKLDKPEAANSRGHYKFNSRI